MKKINLLLLLFLLPFVSFTQQYDIQVSSHTICEGELLRLTAVGCESTVLWQNGRQGKSIVDTVFSDLNYSFTCRNSVTNALIGSSLAKNIKVNPKPKTPFLFCKEDEIKAGRQAKMEVLGCDRDVLWSNGATDKELIVRPMETTTYTVRCLNEFGCESEPISRTIIVSNDKSVSGPVITIKSACLGESLLLKAGGCTQGEYIWYKNEILDKNEGFIAKEIGRGYEMSINDGGDQVFYTARCYFNQCLGNESNRMYVFFDESLPSIALPRKVFLDEGETIDLLTLLPSPSISSNHFEFRSGKNDSYPLLKNVSNIDSPMSIYVTEISEMGNCKSPPAKITIIKNTGAGLFAEREEMKAIQKEVMPQSAGVGKSSFTFLTQQTTATGALISSEKVNDELQGITVAQGFSPNGDGINDQFAIENEINENLSLRVYNRFGHMVYEKENYKNDWDGNANSGMMSNQKIGLPDDTYYYVLRLENGKQKIGFLTLKR